MESSLHINATSQCYRSLDVQMNEDKTRSHEEVGGENNRVLRRHPKQGGDATSGSHKGDSAYAIFLTAIILN